MAEEFGVLRTPIGEAFRPQASIGLVEDLVRRGFLVSKHSTSDLLDAFSVLDKLEGIAVRLAAQHTSDEVLQSAQEVKKLCQKAVSIMDASGFNSANMTFHSSIIKGANNRLLYDQLATARPITFPFRHHISTLPGYMKKSLEEHSNVLSALSTGMRI